MIHDFVDGVERWKIRRALVVISQRDYSTLYMQQTVTTCIYSIISILLIMPLSSATSEKSFSAMRRVKFYLRSTMGDERLSNLSLWMWISLLMTLLEAEGIGALTFHKLIQVKNNK